MNKQQAKKTARDLFEQYGLQEWRFKLDNAKRRLGVCYFSEKIISMSKHLLKHEEGFMNTLKHEVAHAIVGIRIGHGYEWRQKAIELGCDGQRCSAIVLVPHKWIGTCGRCGATMRRHRVSKRLRRLGTHPKCGGGFITWKRGN